MGRCQGKIPYRTIERAELVAAKRSLVLSELLIAYECFDCGRFHIGHADASQKALRADSDLELEQAIFREGLKAVTKAKYKTWAKKASFNTNPLDASRSTVDCSCKRGVICGAKRCARRRARQRKAVATVTTNPERSEAVGCTPTASFEDVSRPICDRLDG
jgi:hypothetical protein